MSSTHLTRKDIKRDEVAEAVGKSVHWVEEHGKTIGLAIAAVVVLVLGVVAFRTFRAGAEQKAGSALAEAMRVANAPIVAQDAKPDDADQPSFATADARRARAKQLFEGVRKEHGSSNAADIAGAFLGQIAIEEGKADEARKLWQDFVDEHPTDMLAGNIRLNLIELSRKEGKNEQLVGELQKLLDAAESPLPQDAVLYELAGVYGALKRDAEAKKAYQRILDEFPQSAYRTLAQQKVGSGVPGLVPGA